MEKKKTRTGLKMATSLFVGLGAGLLAGYLTAPRSGKDTRKKIENDINEAKTKVSKDYKTFKRKVDAEIKDKLLTAKNKYSEVRDVVLETAEKQAKKSEKAIQNFKDKVSN